MCVIAAGAGITAGAALTANIAIAGLAITAAATGVQVYQAQQNARLQAQAAERQQEQAYQQMNLAYQQAQQQQRTQNEQIVAKHIGDVRTQQASRKAYEEGAVNRINAANAGFVEKQLTLKQAKDQQAFRMQEIYAKSIGSQGSVLASGGVGQSVGLLALDAERQGGFAAAKEQANVDSAYDAAELGQQLVSQQALSADNTAYSNVLAPVQAPQFAPKPVGRGTDLQLGIPSYNWT